MQAANRVRVVLKEGKPAFGAWQMLPGTNVSRLLARSGVDWVLIDQEHGNIDGQCVSKLTGDVPQADVGVDQERVVEAEHQSQSS